MKNHNIYYLSLVGILTVGVVLIFTLGPNRYAQMTAIIILSIIYALFGILHHYFLHNLVPKIVVEYILIAMLGITMALFIFRGGFGF